jgi:hypothetical protein
MARMASLKDARIDAEPQNIREIISTQTLCPGFRAHLEAFWARIRVCG